MKNELKTTSFTKASPDENGYYPVNSKDSHQVNTNNSIIPENDHLFLFDYCLVDHSGRQFACVHDHCQEQSICFQSKLLQQKLDFHELRFHPEDRKLWCDEAFPDLLQFINSEPIVEYADYRFIFNHRYIRKDDSISQFMHEGSITFKNEKKTPVLNLNVFFEIADIKSDETMIMTIFRYSKDLGYQKVFTKVYSNNLHSNLTPRELEIVRLCHEGLSSKMIADRLNLSIHTVKNHKRNIMDKTLTHNISELIHLCIKNHWL